MLDEQIWYLPFKSQPTQLYIDNDLNVSFLMNWLIPWLQIDCKIIIIID